MTHAELISTNQIVWLDLLFLLYGNIFYDVSPEHVYKQETEGNGT